MSKEESVTERQDLESGEEEEEDVRLQLLAGHTPMHSHRRDRLLVKRKKKKKTSKETRQLLQRQEVNPRMDAIESG